MTFNSGLLSSSSIFKTAFIVLLLLVASPSAALHAPAPSAVPMCACCAEPGEWYENTARIENYEFEELRRIRFGDTAKTYTTAAGFEGLKGFPAEYDSFSISNFSFNGRRSMTLTLKGERGETGSLVLFLPRAATSFGTDMHDYPEGSAGPILYKEWRFQGLAGGTGIFKKGIIPGTKFFLILQGRGNNCLSSTDFKNWRLEIEGPRASYAFYGSLRDPV